MTANHAHTPTKGDLKKAWDWYRANQDKEAEIEQNFRTYRFEFLRAWDAIEATAEQRGAIKALRDAAESPDLIGHMYREYGEHPLRSMLAPAAVRATSNYLHYRADQMEGDDE